MPTSSKEENVMSTPIVGYLREFDPNTSEWSLFKPRLDNYFQANAISDKDRMRAVLLNLLSEEAYKLLFNLCLPKNPESKSYEDLLKILSAYFQDEESVFVSRYKFYTARKSVAESPKEFAARLRSLASMCQFSEENLKLVLKDMFIIGYNKGSVQDRLFEESINVTFSEAVHIANSRLSTQKVEPHDFKTEPNIYHMKGKEASPTYFGKSRYRPRQISSQRQTTVGKSSSVIAAPARCTVCGRRNHSRDKCYYRNLSCDVCHVQGHLAPMCNRKNTKNSYRKHRNIQHFLESNSLEENNGAVSKEIYSEDTLFILNEEGKSNICTENEVKMYTVNDKIPEKNTVSSEKNTALYLSVLFDKVLVKCQLDTGSSITCISDSFYYKMFSHLKLKSSNKILTVYNGGKIKPAGFFECNIKYMNVNKKISVHVIKNGGPPILGRDFFQNYRLEVSEINYVQEGNSFKLALDVKFPKLFSPGLGKFNKGELTLRLKDNSVTPKFFRPRPLPFSMRDKIEDELNRLIKENIVYPVDFSNWAAPIVPVIKPNNTIRICGDFKFLNQHLEIDQYPLPRIEDLFSKLQGEKIYSKIDLSQAYQQVCLDKKSQELVTISTHKGLFRYTRLPYGVASAPSKFQKIMDALLQDMDGVICFLDDILVSGKDMQEHLNRLEKVLSRLEKSGFKLALNKCDFFKREVTYLGHRIDENGVHTCSHITSAIKNAPVPQNVTQLKSFIGLCMFYTKFAPNLSMMLHPLFNLLKSNTRWVWSNECQTAFDKVKDLLMSAKVLVHYNSTYPVYLNTDSSSYGVGAVISHEMPDGSQRPIAYASRTLSSAEKKYPQHEKEALSIIFGLKKFNQYLYGRHFHLVTDSKPLVSIFNPNKGIPQYSANRLKRWAVMLSNYDYDIKYVKSKENVADCFSRLPLEVSNDSDFAEGEFSYIHFFHHNNLPINFDLLKQHLEKDSTIQTVVKFVKNGWPKKIIDSQVRQYFNFKNQLTIEDNCLMWNDRIVIPSTLRQNVLEKLHQTHLGIVKMKSLSRGYFWWPGLGNDIENFIKTCSACTQLHNNPPRVKVCLWKWPGKPWERIHIDFLGPFRSKYYLVVIDSHSKWLEVFTLKSITAEKTIVCLKSLFARFGLPDLVVSDNGRQFCSSDFQVFLQSNGIKHMTTAPYHPMSNGAAENSVKTVKTALKKFLLSEHNCDINSALCDFLFAYRSAPHLTTGVTPAKLMLGRNLKIPFDLLRPVNDKIKMHVEKRQNSQVKHFKGNRELSPLVGDSVLVRDFRKPNSRIFIKGIVRNILGQCMYNVYIPELQCVWKRHSNQVVKRTEPKGIPTADQEISYERPKRNVRPPDRLVYN